VGCDRNFLLKSTVKKEGGKDSLSSGETGKQNLSQVIKVKIRSDKSCFIVWTLGYDVMRLELHLYGFSPKNP